MQHTGQVSFDTAHSNKLRLFFKSTEKVPILVQVFGREGHSIQRHEGKESIIFSNCKCKVRPLTSIGDRHFIPLHQDAAYFQTQKHVKEQQFTWS